MDIRAAIRAEQGWHKLNDSQLAEKAGIVQSTFSRRMNGREFKLVEIQKIAKALELPLSELISKAEQRAEQGKE